MSRFAALLSVLFEQWRSWWVFPEAEPVDYPFVRSDVARLYGVNADACVAPLDDQTWNDLLLDQYSARLAAATSIFGQQVQHQRLRAGLDDEACATLGTRLQLLTDDPLALAELHHACRPLRRADLEVTALLFTDPVALIPAWESRLWLLPVALLAFLAGVVLTPWSWLGAGAVLGKLMAMQMRYHERVAEWERAMQTIGQLLRTCSLLGARSHPLLHPFAGMGTRAGRVNRGLSRSIAIRLVPGMKEYSDWFMLGNLSHYFKCIRLVAANLDFLRDCYLRVATLEADIALARHQLETPTCRAQRHACAGLGLIDAVHPLLEKAEPLSIALDGKGAFISGQNGIGKSTLLRTVGLNLVSARAFGFCYARSASVPAGTVYANMQGEDAMLSGESLYLAELRRARELLAAANRPEPAIFLIDEIFRGTNHLESVAAAASVLDALAARGLVIVASHNVVLAPLLQHCLAPLCVTAPAEGGARLALVPGVLAHPNGIALLAERGFDSQINANAAAVFDWLSTYLAHPAGGFQVLGTPPQP